MKGYFFSRRLCPLFIIENENDVPGNTAAVKEAISKHNIMPGDLLYFGELDANGIPEIHHATIITNVYDDALMYAGNTVSILDYSLTASFKSSENKMVFIVPIGEMEERND